MTLRRFAVKAAKMTADNSPAILTAIGVTGTITVAYLTGKATFKAAEVIRQEQFKQNIADKGHPLDNREKFNLVWRLYVPAVGTGVLTIACIVSANHIGTRRAAALATAYSLSERAFVEYREKIVEKIGENKERAARDEIAQDNLRKHPPTADRIIITGDGDVLCQMAFDNTPFRSNMEKINKAVNEINYQVLHYDSATVNEFYSKLNLPPTDIGEEMGWNTDKLLEIHTSAVLTEDNEPCMVVTFATMPVREPWRFC